MPIVQGIEIRIARQETENKQENFNRISHSFRPVAMLKNTF